MKKYLFFLAAALMAAVAFPQLSFVQDPALAYRSATSDYLVTFEVNQATDVAVSIVNMKDSTILRHLAAGMLGPSAPAPLAANSLSQSIVWDGNDDQGNAVSDSAVLSVRVRAGMSVALNAIVDQNPYYFSSVNGASLGDDGSVYVYGIYGSYGFSMGIRKYDGSGNYVKTLYPYPAGMDTGSVYGFGIHMREDNTYCPEYPAGGLHHLPLSGSMAAQSSTKLLNFTISNNVILYNTVSYWPNPSKIEMVQIGDNSSIGRNGGQVPLITSPGTIPTAGPKLFTRSADGSTLYLSGAYSYIDLGSYTYTLADTGFWQDGRVYKIDFATGAAQVWATIIPIDSIPDFGTDRYNTTGPVYNGHPTAQLDFAALHGVALDAGGRLYVCDRIRQEVGIYDTTTWTKVSSISVNYPHQVDINPSTGEIYVLSRHITGYNTGLVSLYKFSGWQNPVQTAVKADFIPSITHYGTLVRMVVSYGGAKPVIWLTEKTVWAIQDDGAAFTELRKFSDLCVDESSQRAPQLFERLAVDLRNETLYATDGWSGFYKIADWTSRTAVQCSTSANRVLLAGEPCVSPDGYLYIRSDPVGTRGGGFSGPIVRYTTDWRHAPAPFPAIGTNVIDSSYYGRYGIAYGDKGIDVSRTGRVAVMDMFSWVDYGINVFLQDGSLEKAGGTVYPLSYGMASGRTDLPYNCGGVKFDYDGNLYVGALVRPPEHVVPPDFTGDEGYAEGVGAVIKYPPAGGSVTGGTTSYTAAGALKVYAQGFGGFSGLGHFCQCRSPRFELDRYGRLFIPNALTSEVAVADNNGNTILTFGEYANVDSKGPGSLVPGPEIPLATPLCVAASEDYIYVSDINNARLVRVKMNYVLDNIPGLPGLASSVENESEGPEEAVAMAAAPNPFNPVCYITVRAPAKRAGRLDVYDVSGRIVATLKAGEFRTGTHRVAWNARDRGHRAVSAGVYVLRLTYGNQVLNKKVMLVK